MELALATAAFVASAFLWMQSRHLKSEIRKLKLDLDIATSQRRNMEEAAKNTATFLGSLVLKVSKGGRITEQEIREMRLFDNLDGKTAAALVQGHKDCVIVDVREGHEVAMGRIPGALHIPVGQIETRFAEIPKTAPHVIVYCAAGARSAGACEYLSLQQGYLNLHNLEGGVHAWPSPLVKP